MHACRLDDEDRLDTLLAQLRKKAPSLPITPAITGTADGNSDIAPSARDAGSIKSALVSELKVVRDAVKGLEAKLVQRGVGGGAARSAAVCKPGAAGQRAGSASRRPISARK